MSTVPYITAIPAIVYTVAFTCCLCVILGGIARRLPEFDYIWLYPLGFVLFRMATLTYLAAEALGRSWKWDNLPLGLIVTLALSSLAKLALFGPAITIFIRRLAAGSTTARGSYLSDRKYFKGQMYAAIGTLCAALNVVAAVLEVIGVQSAQTGTWGSIIETANIMAPTSTLLFINWICYWIFRQLRAHPQPELRPPAILVFVLAVFLTITTLHQIADRVSLSISGSKLSMWYFWGLQISVELIMTILVIHTLLRYKRPLRTITNDESLTQRSPAEDPLIPHITPPLSSDAYSSIVPSKLASGETLDAPRYSAGPPAGIERRSEV